MKSEIEDKDKDKDGYLLPAKQFTKLGFNHIFVKELENNWNIYKRNKEGIPPHWELIRVKKQEEFEIAGNIIPKKWAFPSSSLWGIDGFTLFTEEDCIKKYNEIKNQKQEELEVKQETDKTLIIPTNTKFTIPELAAKLGVDNYVISNKLKELGEKVEVVGEKKNPRGRNSKVYMIKE